MNKNTIHVLYAFALLFTAMLALAGWLRNDKPDFYCNGSSGVYYNRHGINVQSYDPKCCKPVGDDCNNG